ncbi:MAG: formimidoylglutamate deiminase [Pelomonas sp.]|nr:formimidoylglutamate deiminase [Roseateles sp.]
MSRIFFAERAWVGGAWRRGVRLTVGADGGWQAIDIGAPADGAERLAGPVLPSLVDAHSHAFQRAFAGLAETRERADDDFWSWRERMYGLALRLTPEQLHAIAAQLYVELLEGGYTQVCEFHYLHHAADGTAHADPYAMSWALADAAADAGLGLTVLPVLYAHAGFAQPGLRAEQRRFATDADWVWRASRAVNAARRPLVNAGVALHSLRAAHAADVDALKAHVGDADLPIHIHIAEQPQEVADCVKATGQRPMDYLCTRFAPDARWQLVHATHSVPAEIAAVARSGAGVVLCPGTEANLGDGACDLPGWLAASVPLSIGSDSQVTRGVAEELRWLEYGQRLARGQRNIAAAPGREPASAARLFEACVQASAAPAGFACWGLAVGARADFLVLDPQASGLLGLPAEHALDGWIFASQGQAIRDVYVAGAPRVRGGRHVDAAAVAARFAAVMDALWSASR